MRAALAFLTPLPVGSRKAPTGRALLWFPFVGLLIGAALGLSWRGIERVFDSGLVTAALVVALDLALTGMLHFDGLVDSADGLLPPVERERRLDIMRDPAVGAFGLAAGVVVLLLRIGPLTGLRPVPLLIAGLWCLSRTLMAVIVCALPYARADDGGLATSFLDEVPNPGILLLAGLALAAIPLVGWDPWRGLVVLAAASAAGFAVAGLARRRLGGFTGDVLGATGVVAETAGLIVAVAL